MHAVTYETSLDQVWSSGKSCEGNSFPRVFVFIFIFSQLLQLKTSESKRLLKENLKTMSRGCFLARLFQFTFDRVSYSRTCGRALAVRTGYV